MLPSIQINHFCYKLVKGYYDNFVSASMSRGMNDLVCFNVLIDGLIGSIT